MATAKKTPDTATPEVVKLHCKKLGKTEDFSPAHAQALLELQADRGLSDWQPVTAEVSTDNA
jgi:hypothetical protein